MTPPTPNNVPGYRWEFSKVKDAGAVGAQIDRFTVVGRLGQGGMGTVLRVSDESGRQLALKLMGPAPSPQARVRFEREGQITAALKHVGIVGIHGAGSVGEHPYLVYELVEGKDLEESLPELTREERLDVIGQVASALGYAHDAGVVHRDVKLANVLIGEDGRVLVADFGLAQAAGLERLTRTGAVLGTPTSMAPEQISGKSEDFGPQTDVWALGVLLYQALTDRVPFEGESMVALMAQITSQNPSPPRALDPSVAEAVERVCLKALKKSPKDRYPDGNAFASALEAARVSTANPSRGRWSVVAAIALCVALLVIAGVSQGPFASEPPIAAGESTRRVAGLPAGVEVSLVAALGASPAKAASSLQHVAAKLRERPDVVARVDRIRLARIERARQLPFGSALLPLELELLGVLARCRSPNAKAEGPEFLAKQTELLEFVLASLEENMWTDTLTVATGISVLVALEAAELPFSEAADLSARKLADALLGSARYNTVTRDQYLAGLVAMARLDVGLEHCHLLLFMANNPFPPGRAWLGKQTSDPVRLAVQSLIQTRPSDAPRNRRALLELLEGPAPAWGPRLRARVLGMLSYGDSPALAVERLQEARELDPRWPWAQGALGKAQLAAGDPALALASAERAVALQHEMGFDLRPGTRWETPWLRVNVVQALVRLKRYEDAAKKLDALLVDHAELPALVSLQKAGVFRLLEEKLGRTFDWEPVPLPRDGRR